MNNYSPILKEQNPDRLHPFLPNEHNDCRWCDVPQEKHVAPWYYLVPKDLQANIDFRERMLDTAANDRAAQLTLTRMCREDLLFYANAACWIFEPRGAKQLPFITYGYQDEALLVIRDCTGKCDLVIEKSRDMGASWCNVTEIQHAWMFNDFNMFLLLSRKEELVEKRGDPKSLFWKFDYLTDHLPWWLRPACEATKMHRENLGNGSSTDGESTNEFAGVADRRLKILLDEYSKMNNQDVIAKGTRDTTDSRVFNFTPQGSNNEAYRIAQNPNFRKLTLHWSLHPHKARGLYRVGAQGKPEIIDHGYWTPERMVAYSFSTTKPDNPRFEFRSPWYDEQCKRALHPKEIAEELDIDYLATNYNFYDGKTTEELIVETARAPMLIGELHYDHDLCQPLEFVPSPSGKLRLWIRPDGGGRIPDGRRFIVAADVAMGTAGEYASDSTLSIVDKDTGEKVGEFADNATPPHTHARLAIALARWFSGSQRDGSQLIWEMNGPGVLFGREVLTVGYSNIYYREKLKEKKGKRGKVPGFFSIDGPDGTKIILHGGYRRALAERRFINRSAAALRQCMAYVWTPERKIEHQAALTSDDPVTAGANHGDLVVSDALACLLLEEKVVASAPEKRYHSSSIYARLQSTRRERVRENFARY